VPDIFTGYEFNGAWDEMFRATGKLRSHYRHLYARVFGGFARRLRNYCTLSKACCQLRLVEYFLIFSGLPRL